MSTEPNPYHPPGVDPLPDLPLKPAFDWRRIRWAIGIWLMLVIGIFTPILLEGLGLAAPSPRTRWSTVMLLGLALTFVFYNLLILILVFVGFFRKKPSRR